MKKPNLFIVGAPKSGTTALYEMLKNHPDICMCNEKEPGFFAEDFFEESIEHHGRNFFRHCTTIEEYFNLFNCRDEKIIGEASTHYLYSTVAADKIFNFNPESKIIIMLREPVDFMHALHSQQVSETREDEQDFEKALALENLRKRGLHIPKRTRCPSYHFYRKQASYLIQVQRFTKNFAKDQILIIIFEDFKNNNRRYLDMIVEFLDIDRTTQLTPKIVNKNKNIRYRHLFYFVQSPLIKYFCRKRINTKTYFQIKSITDRIFFKIEKRKEIEPKLRLQLKSEFYPMVKKLNLYLHREEFITQDLIHLWGYDHYE